MSNGGSNRKRPIQVSNLTAENPMPWQYHPVYGIVHLVDCSICSIYMTHIVEADRQPSFQLALQDRDHKRDIYFFDGVNEGRRRQRDDDEYLYEERQRYRTERNEAREKAFQYKLDLQHTLDALHLTQEQLRASLDECEKLRIGIERWKGLSDQPDNSSVATKGMEVEQMLMYPSSSPTQHPIIDVSRDSHLDPRSLSTSQARQATAHPVIQQLDESSHVSLTSSNPTPITYAAVASQPANQPSTIASAPSFSVTVQSVTALPNKPTMTMPKTPSADLRATVAQTGGGNLFVPRNPKNIRQLRSLMNAAHQPGNDGALAKIKGLCAEAHSTPREQKTELQRYLLSNWRNPSPAGDTSYSTSTVMRFPQLPIKVNPRMDDPVEVWYEYLCAHPASWPKGVRRDSQQRPVMSDLKASRTVARLRPDVDSSGNVTSRSEFMTRVIELLSQTGMYAELIRKNDIRISLVESFKPYLSSSPITIEDVVRHFANCGVTIDVAIQQLEPWALNYLGSSTPASST
ncbi:hypothetical protein BDQ12DRAFT_721681 [Crucibulum laeve]|uniref:Uncharacterized protein n=1 Tax=Crucibulum laeve TaxID=68775 RepID=A0A5C3M4K6_9AGAR|nr:hypothetical protein BDQ12DRAFT_721681 [Crucibulum laeve]